ncbi:fumarylacetoacetate hydrolase family protein [Sphingobium phenoxybenzoativorans]|uniref:fumarylacetoacetate hydrolase family protein n=1 Tax=Sphingobium phenoxybenzoativorans TaxID=1592790 RepID=UPI00209B22CD|nr:fumarylacetoacetate hydrolase family protein [Sphingobium phenoxybenzoativorans]
MTDGIIPIARHLPEAPADMIALIADWPNWSDEIASLACGPAEIALDTVRLLPPIRRPGKICCIGLNYADHVAESNMDSPSDQLWFSKPATAVIGPNDNIRLPRVSEQLDYEAELVVVIGKVCRYANTEEARAAIFGYCVGNDVSVRDWQFRTSQFMLGKSFDSHAPHGPCIATANEIDVSNLHIQCRVNGETRQSSNTQQLIFDPIEQIQHLSQVMTLEPGDLLFTGTPSGVGAGFKPPRWLREGDVVETEISGIGAMSNRVIAD